MGGGGSEEGTSQSVEALKLSEAKAFAGEQKAESVEPKLAETSQTSSSDDSVPQTPSKLSSASSTGSLKKLSAKAKGECRLSHRAR